MRNNDTIVAQATAFGNAGVAIIRVSGANSLSILRKIFKPQRKGLKKFESHRMYYGIILDRKKESMDEVLACYFNAPRTYTKEDMIEIQCHGGFITANKVLKRVLEEKVRMARPGEFTERAFLNGRIDLTQAEAVADIIYAKSDKAQELAERQLGGYLGETCKSILNSVANIYGSVLTNIDFPEEDIPEITKEEIIRRVAEPQREIKKILEGASLGTIYKEGLRVAIVGLPNAGKSSILNALVKDARAIVTNIPGTTRDILEEQIELDGILVRLFDTAGITVTENRIEKEGVVRSFSAIKSADLLILVVEQPNDLKKFLSLSNARIKKDLKDKKIILVRNKVDVNKGKKELKNTSGLNIIKFLESSAKTGKGIRKIEESIRNQAVGISQESSVLLTNLRHVNLFKKALESLNKIESLAFKEEVEDKILIELDCSIHALKEIIGEEITENILGKVFSRFCVGK